MDNNNFYSKLNSIGLLKFFSDLDTQRAITVAVMIPTMTFFVTVFSNLCNFVYWSAYFNRFNIPLTYIDDAIIPENNIKYIIILSVPVIVFIWLIFESIKNTTIKVFFKIEEKYKNKHIKMINFLKKTFYILVIFISITMFPFLVEMENFIVLSLYFEFVIFVLWNISKRTIGKKFSFSKSKYYSVRLSCIFTIIYLIFGAVYCFGAYEGYSIKGGQNLQIIYDSHTNYYNLNNEDEISSELILFETEDYFYVTDIIIRKNDQLQAIIYGTDSYRFIEKIDCPTKTIYAYLSYIGRNTNAILLNTLPNVYNFAVLIFAITIVALLSIPKKKEFETKSKN